MRASTRGALVMLVALCAGGSVEAASWRFSEHKDPITDKVATVAFLWKGQTSLMIGCMAPEPEAMTFSFSLQSRHPGYFGNGRRPFVYRLDGLPPVEAVAEYERGTGSLRGADALAAIQGLANARKVAVRGLSASGSAFGDEFDVSGSAKAVERIIVSCGGR